MATERRANAARGKASLLSPAKLKNIATMWRRAGSLAL
jgi:hypothetical protein